MYAVVVVEMQAAIPRWRSPDVELGHVFRVNNIPFRLSLHPNYRITVADRSLLYVRLSSR